MGLQRDHGFASGGLGLGSWIHKSNARAGSCSNDRSFASAGDVARCDEHIRMVTRRFVSIR